MKAQERLTICIKALRGLVNPSGAYSMDRLEHAENTIKAVSDLAIETLKEIGIHIEK